VREVAHLLRRITASVSLLDDGFGSGAVAEDDTDSSGPPRAHAEQPSAGPPFSWQDVLTLRELLETDMWTEHIADHRIASRARCWSERWAGPGQVGCAR
jgi:hypothetical protein